LRGVIRDFASICSRSLPLKDPIYEFGSLQVPGQEGFADLRAIFAGRTYVGADRRTGPGVDVILDLHEIDLPPESVGTLLSFETLEHVERPWKAVDEMHRVLKPGGLLAISSLMNHPIHDYPSDYWRFTPEAFRSLLRPFDRSIVESAGDELFPHTIVGVALKNGETPPDLAGFSRDLAQWKRCWSRRSALWVWQDWVRYLFPPFLVDAAKAVIPRRR
jgi:SAM-dependent methyltransferase